MFKMYNKKGFVKRILHMRQNYENILIPILCKIEICKFRMSKIEILPVGIFIIIINVKEAFISLLN